MTEAIEISSDSSDTIILSPPHLPENLESDDTENIVNKYILDNLNSEADSINISDTKLEEQFNQEFYVPLSKRVKKSDACSSSRASQDETMEKLREKYKQVDEETVITKENIKPVNQKEFIEQQRKLKKQEKIKEKEQKKKEAEQEKCLKKIVAAANKNLKPSECMKFITVVIDKDITSEEYGSEIATTLQQAEVQYIVQSQAFPGTITWIRKVQSHLSDDDGKLLLITKDEDTEELLLIMNVKEFVEHISNNTLCAYIQSLKSVLINKRITLVIYGLQTYYKYLKKNQNKEKVEKRTIFSGLPQVTKKIIEEGLTELQLLCSCSHRLIDSPSDLGLLVAQFTKAVAEVPFKLQKFEKCKQTDWFAAGDNRDCAKVDKNGNGLNRLWNQMLTTFPLARLETAEAISSMYPTVSALMTAYEECTKKPELLLQDIPVRRAAGPLSSTRKIGPELSKKLHTFFTSLDGDTVL